MAMHDHFWLQERRRGVMQAYGCRRWLAPSVRRLLDGLIRLHDSAIIGKSSPFVKENLGIVLNAETKKAYGR